MTLRSNFLGRERELTALDEAVARGARTIQIVGPAGIGKTRLAEEWGAARSEVVVDTALSSQGERDQVQVVTTRREQPERSDFVMRLRALSTEAAVAIYDEQCRRQNPMATADIEQTRRLVLALDGIPLLIELAARQAFLLGAQNLLEELERGPRLLEEGGPDGHRLRAFVEAAFDACDEQARALGRAATTLDGMFTADAFDGWAGVPHASVGRGLQKLVSHCLLEPSGAPNRGFHMLWFVRAVLSRKISADVRSELVRDRARHLSSWVQTLSRPEDATVSASPPSGEHGRRLAEIIDTIEATAKTAPDAAVRLATAATSALRWYYAPSRLGSVFAVALQAARDSGLQAEATVLLGHWLFMTISSSGVDGIEEEIDRMLAQPAPSLDSPEVCMQHALVAFNLTHRERVEDAEELYGRATTALTRLPPSVVGTSARNALGLVDLERGRFERAREALDRVLFDASKVGHDGLAIIGHINRGQLALHTKDDARAAEHLRQAQDRLRQADRLRYEAVTTFGAGLLDMLTGVDELGRARFEQSFEASRRAADVRGKGFARLALGLLDAAAGDLNRAIVQLEEAREYLGRTHYLGMWRQTCASVGWIYRRTGATQLAAQRFDQARHDLPTDAFPGLARALDILEHDAEAGEALGLPQRLAEFLVGDSGQNRQDPTILVGPDGAWFSTPVRERVPLGRRKAARSILCALARAPSGQSKSADVLFEAGWPGEDIAPDLAARRVYVVVHDLRRLGLERYLKTTGDGYAMKASLVADPEE